MDKNFKQIITETEQKNDMLIDEARKNKREAEKKAYSDAAAIKDAGIKRAKQSAEKIISEAQNKAASMKEESEALYGADEEQIKKATWATSEEAASFIVGKVINL